MKTVASLAILLSCVGTACAQESVSSYRLGLWEPRNKDACNTIYGDTRDLCLADRYRMQQAEKVREQQVALQRAEEENQKLHNELLRRQLTQPPVPTAAVDLASIAGFAGWQAENRWFGADRPRTEYALMYARDLREQQPELIGRPFLNALSARVKEIFSPAKR